MLTEVRTIIERCRSDMTTLLSRLVNIDSGSHYKRGVDRIGRLLAHRLERIGFECVNLPNEDLGDNFVCKREGPGRGRFVLLGHLDTVFPRGTVDERPFSIRRDRAYGPGVCDMKAGLVSLVHALAALEKAGFESYGRLTVVLGGDEEIGSPTSRPIILEEVRGFDAALVLEGGRPDGSVVTARKGVAMFQLETIGRAAHAGQDPRSGVSAIEALAHHILALHRLRDADKGISVNVGLVSGGTRANVVAASATATVDVRFRSQRDCERIAQAMQEAVSRPVLPGAGARLTGGVNRPAMPRTEGNAWLFQRARKVAARLGLELHEAETGGGSDGNFVAEAGIPVLDGLGPVGGGAHGPEEYLELSSLPERTQLLAGLLLELGDHFG